MASATSFLAALLTWVAAFLTADLAFAKSLRADVTAFLALLLRELLAGDFLAAVFFAAGFLAATLGVAFFAVTFFAAGFFAATFFTALAPAFFAGFFMGVTSSI
ncbi:hypothetical protein E4T66_06565 [Sinimarinibacterium sp. CAU 1509]|nr:hypothetical protein E4T66_06565 [Sinimarinibacterium sp. CAU 1509]